MSMLRQGVGNARDCRVPVRKWMRKIVEKQMPFYNRISRACGIVLRIRQAEHCCIIRKMGEDAKHLRRVEAPYKHVIWSSGASDARYHAKPIIICTRRRGRWVRLNSHDVRPWQSNNPEFMNAPYMARKVCT